MSRRLLLTTAGMALLGLALACVGLLAVDRLVAAGVAVSVAQLGVLVVGVALVSVWYRWVTAVPDTEPAPPAPGTCVHGEAPDPARPQLRARGRRLRAAERHEADCPGAHLFWHPHGLRRRVCCATCGARVA